MAITSMDGVIAGGRPPIYYRSTISGGLGEPPWFTPFYLASIPGAAAAPTSGMSGTALTSYPGQIPFTNPPVGQSTYLTRFSANPLRSGGGAMLADRLWHSSGINLNTPAVQTVNSVAFPPRDVNQSSDGEGVYIAVEIATTLGSGNAVFELSYTNSAGVAGRLGYTIPGNIGSSQPSGTFCCFSLQSGDSGVRSVQSIRLTAGGYLVGTMGLVAYRPISLITCIPNALSLGVDCLTGAMPELFNDSVPFLVFRPDTNTATEFESLIVFSQG
jgi:hypothetical protein